MRRHGEGIAGRATVAAVTLAAVAACTTPGDWRTFPPELDVPVELAVKLTVASLEDHLIDQGVEVLCFGRPFGARIRAGQEGLMAWQARMRGRLRDLPFPVIDAEGCTGLGGRYVVRSNETPAAMVDARPIDERADGGEQFPYRTNIGVRIDRRRNAGQFQIGYEFSRTPDGWWIDGISCFGPREPCERVKSTMPVGATPALPDTAGVHPLRGA